MADEEIQDADSDEPEVLPTGGDMVDDDLAAVEKLQEAIDLAERQYDLTHEFRNQTQMDGLRFEAYLELGRQPETKRAFDRYYSSVKDTCGRLPHKGFVDDYLESSEFVERVDKFRDFEKKNRARE